MFSSNPSISNINPNANPSFSSYLHCAPLFAGGYGNGDVLLNHHHQQLDPLTGGFVLPAANHHQYLTNMAFTTGYGINSNTAVINTSNFMGNNNKKVMKKDRHSKICTAQGLRDRRVRLSIDIAREFFDLQDMLGFDKPSKTLEWLLNKSRNAIKELTELRNINVDDCELEEAATTTDSRSCNKQMEGISEERKIMEKLTKESRDKARARARQRTRDKLCKKIAESSNSYAVVSHDHDHNQVQEPCSHSLANQAPTEYEGKQNPSSNFAYERQNLEISNTSSYDFNLPQNWDIISSAMPHQYYSTSFRAITKHESSKW